MEATRPPTGEELATQEFLRYGNELVPGAAERLGRLFADRVGHPSAEARMREAVEVLDAPLAARYRNVEHKAPTTADGQPASPLRVAIARYKDDLRPDVLDQIHDLLAADVAGLPPARVAAALGRFLDRPEGRKMFNAAYESRQFRVRRPEPAEAAAEPVREPDGRFASPPARRGGSVF